MNEADTLNSITTFAGFATKCSVAIAGIGVLLLILQKKTLSALDCQLEATHCVACHLSGSKKCRNGFKTHCDSVIGERQVYEKEKHEREKVEI